MLYRVKFLPCILVAFFASLFFFVSFLQNVEASTLVSSDIEVDTTWTLSGSPYILERSTIIFEGATLTIEPGVEVKFKENYFSPKTIYVYGKILAVGIEANPIIFTSNADDTYSNTDDDEDCYFNEYDEDGNGIGDEICDYYDWYDPAAGDWGGFYFSESMGSVFENVNIKYAKKIANISTSTLSFKNINFLFAEGGITAFNDSVISAENLFFDEVQKDIFVLFNDSFLNFKNIKVRNLSNDAFVIFNRSIFSGEGLDVEDNYFNFRGDTIVLFNSSSLIIKNSSFKSCGGSSCISFFDGNNFLAEPSRVEIEDSIFEFGSGPALITFGNSVISATVKNSFFSGFETYAIESYAKNFTINATNNYWGDPSGPYEPILNPNSLGEKILGKVNFQPWLKKNPRDVCKVDCFSNILFLPGMQGSRLYENIDDNEEELWFTRKDSYHERMYLDENGKSINQIYTKNDTKNTGEDNETGIIDEATLGINIYESFIDSLREWKINDVIEDYAFVPYDWRLPLNDIVSNGNISEGKVSFIGDSVDEPYIIANLRALAESSKSEKVTIIAHSYGGIVTKALLQKLKDAGDPLYEKIDKIIFVAVPQIGTPQSALAILHGTGVGKGLVMDKDISRTFAENMETAYNLLPRENYFDIIDPAFETSRLISFEDSPLLEKQIKEYGFFILNKKELKNYLLGTDGREKPEHHDTKNPNIANAKIYENAESVYELADNWNTPAGTKVIQVAGWGAETTSGLDYKTYLAGTKKSYISYKIRKVIDGDGTVVIPSALWMPENENTERWWVNLYKESKKSRVDKNKDHADILEIDNLLSFILSKIKNTDFSDPENIVVNDTSTLISDGKRLHYTLHSPLYLGVLDSEGKFSGRNANGEIYNEIPNVFYEEIGEVQFLSIPAELAHTLKLSGYSEGVFALDADEVQSNENLDSILFQGIKTGEDTVVRLVVSENADINKFKLELDFDGDGDFEETINHWKEKEEIAISSGQGSSGGGGSGFPFVPQVLASVTEVLPTLIPTLEPINNKQIQTQPLGKVLGENTEQILEDNNVEPSEIVGEQKLELPSTTEPKEKGLPIKIIISGGLLIIFLAWKYVLKI